MWEQSGFGERFDIIQATDYGLLFVPPTIEPLCPVITVLHGSLGQLADHDPLVGRETEGVLARLIESSAARAAYRLQTYSSANARFWQTETGREVEIVLPAFKLPPLPHVRQTDQRGLVVGRVQRCKGPQVLCAALRLLGRAAPPIDWVGRDAPWGEKTKSGTAHLRGTFPDVWGKRVAHLPQVDREEVFGLQSSAAFNVVPSVWDVFNFTVIEGMASARPTLVSTGAGAADLIEDGATAFCSQATRQARWPAASIR
jgi:glycosyltransferase involved in cell wall biosynthesis